MDAGFGFVRANDLEFWGHWLTSQTFDAYVFGFLGVIQWRQWSTCASAGDWGAIGDLDPGCAGLDSLATLYELMKHERKALFAFDDKPLRYFATSDRESRSAITY